MSRISPAQRAAQRRIARQIAELGFVLPGSVVRRYTTCGNPGCHCMADPPILHGPYPSWTRKVAGTTVTRRITDEQLADYRPWFANARRLRELVAELEGLSIEVVGADPRSSAARAAARSKQARAQPRKTPAT